MSKDKKGLLPERHVAERVGVSVRTLHRWDVEGVGLPPVIYLRGRRYRSAAGVEKFERDSIRKVSGPRPQRQAQTQAMPRDDAGRLSKPAKPAKIEKRKPAKRAHQHAAR